jgi:citrate/tricarballylate utilization protein
MHPLERLTAEAAALAGGAGLAPEADLARQLGICNACRYCEAYCAVFPAMTRRLAFDRADVHYLANLCHHCGACLHACQYAPPHEFAVALPRALARVRARTWAEYAWPPALGALYRRNDLTVALALCASLAGFLAAAAALNGTLWGAQPGGDFYRVFPHGLMVAVFAPVFLFALFALAMGVRHFLAVIGPATGSIGAQPAARAEAAAAALTLRYLDGGHGEGCHEADDAPTHARRRFHHLVFYGFALCLAATAAGTFLHYALAWPAPYDLPALPKLLGSLGGVAMVIGTAGLWVLHRRRHPLHADPGQAAMDRGFIALLFLVAASGLLLWGVRATPAMPIMLCAHLGAVLALFLTLPYGRFAHGAYRAAALLRYAVERRLPSPVGPAGD